MAQYQNVACVNPATGEVTQIDVDAAAVNGLVAGDGLVWVPMYGSTIATLDRRISGSSRSTPRPKP